MPGGRAAIGEFGVAFVVLAASYALLAGKVSADEIALGLGGGALAAVWTVVSPAAEIRFRFDWKAVVTFLGAIAAVPRAAARVTWALFKAGLHRPRGSTADLPFVHGRDRGAADATRRAIVLLSLSLAPDQFALSHEGDRLRVHRLVAGPPGRDKQWPV